MKNIKIHSVVIKQLFISNSFQYIYVTIIASLLSILKSYLLMRFFSNAEVGIISFIQSIIMFVSFSQIGLLNGGYRQISKSNSHINLINNFIFTYNFYLILFSIFFVISYSFIFNLDFDLIILIYSIVAGFVSIISNWLTNLLIADNKINLLNKVNLISLFLSFTCLLFVKVSFLWSGILFVTSQSFFFIILSLYLSSYKIRLTTLKKRTFKYIFLAGFTPYIINLIGSFFLLFEKWIILANLGINNLGVYYIVGVYSAFFQLIPGALANIEFSAALRTYKKHETLLEKINTFKFYFLKLSVYIILVGFITYFLIDEIFEIFLPHHVDSIHLIKIVYWGLSLVTIVQPIILVFQIKFDYKLMLSVYFISFFLVVITFYIYSRIWNIKLETCAFLNLFYNLLISFLFIIIFFFKNSPFYLNLLKTSETHAR